MLEDWKWTGLMSWLVLFPAVAPDFFTSATLLGL